MTVETAPRTACSDYLREEVSMSNVWYDMMVDRCIDQVEELSDSEVLEMVPDYLDMCERSDINVSIDEARALAQDYLFGLEMADQ